MALQLAADPARICIIKPSALGDVVQALPLLPALRKRFPRAELAWVVNRELAGVLEGHPALDEVLPFERRGSWRAWATLLGTLRRRRFDLVFDLQGLARTALMTWATGAPLRVGLGTAREGASLACHVTIPETGRDVPAHARYWRVAEWLGAAEGRPQTTVAVAAADWEWARRTLAGRGAPVVVMHPGAKWETKRWPAEKFAAVARQTLETSGGTIVIVGSGGEADLAARMRTELARFGDSVLDLTGGTSLKQLAALLQCADVLVSNDSGPLHLAAGLGVPVVGLFTCTSPIRSGPPGDAPLLLAADVPCAASYCKSCPQSGTSRHACFDALQPAVVARAVAQQLALRRVA